MRIRKRAPQAAEAATGAKELGAVQKLSLTAEGSLSSHGAGSRDGAHDEDESCRSRKVVPAHVELVPRTSYKHADGENIVAEKDEEAARRTYNSQLTDDTISPVSTELSSTLETCTRHLESNSGGQDHRNPQNAIHLEERLNSSMVHIGINTKGGTEGGKNTSSILNISSKLLSYSTLDADRDASDCSVLFQSLVNVFDRAGRNGLTASEATGPDKLDLELHGNGFLQHLSSLEDGKCVMLKKSRRKRGGHTAAAAVFSVDLDTEAEGGTLPRQEESCAQDVIKFRKRRRRAPASQRELAIGPTQCKRYDGRGWQCKQKTEEGYSFCEHHQALINKRALRLKLGKIQSCTTHNNLSSDMQLSTGGIQAKSLADIDAAAKLHQLTKPLNGVLKLQVQQQE
ncbi:unnamed protein product [Sphagnum troendelagicum]|uniref:WRC domain-containing protein n=1 Tax=Sphagnum troendelagicum TaxID=128251 RepID=A0ABP0U565_9BRYO